MEEFILQYWLEVLFGIALTLTGFGFRCIFSKLRELASVKMGVQALLRDRIIQACNHYMDKEYCPIYALENIEKMYKEYHNLGGNGTITKLVEDIRELPTEKREKESLT